MLALFTLIAGGGAREVVNGIGSHQAPGPPCELTQRTRKKYIVASLRRGIFAVRALPS